MSDFDTILGEMFEGVSDDAPESTDSTETAATETADATSADSTTDQPQPLEDGDGQPAEAVTEEVPAAAAAGPVAATTTNDQAAAAPLVPADLPEGATVEIDKKTGLEYIRYPKPRGLSIYAGYKAANELAKAIGQETLDEAGVRDLTTAHGTLIDIETRMSEGADRQQAAIEYLLTTGAEAFNQGIVAQDPHQHTATAFLAAAEKVAPAVVGRLQSHFESLTVDALYQKALAAGVNTDAGKALLGVAQRADQALTGKWRKLAEVISNAAAPDPSVTREKSLSERERRIQEFERAREDERWDAWGKTATEERRATAKELVDGYLAPVRTHMASLPKDVQEQNLKNLEVRLERELTEGLKSDSTWGPRMQTLFERAKNARSEEYRGQVRAQIKAQFAAKAREILTAKAPAIINSATAAIVANSKAQHQRLANSQGQVRTTTATGSAPPPTLPRQPNGKWKSSSDVARDLEALFN